VKKGRHRRFEEARDLKRAVKVFGEADEEPCPECGAEAGKEHASWCLATEDEYEDGEDGDDGEGYAASGPAAGYSGADKEVGSAGGS
jgi:hypothetical protein